MNEPKDLPPYSGEDVRCVKCGYKGAGTSHKERAELYSLHKTCDLSQERLCRRCHRCGYSWDEQVVINDRRPT